MGFLRRLLGGTDGGAPDWTPFGDGASYRDFIDAVSADLRRRDLRFEIDDGLVSVEGSDGAEPGRYGLSNLAQLCHANDPGDWSRIIAAHFTSLLAMQGRDLDALAADFEQVKSILAVRLMPDESMGGIALPESVVRPVAPGIVAVLVFDFPDSTATVTRDHLAAWPVDADAAIDQGLANLAGDPQPLHEDVDSGDATFTVWYGDSFYVATRVLRLDALLPTGTTDALVVVPNRHTFAVHPIVDASALAAMQALYRIAVQLYRDGPGSISDQPYWWHDGALVQIPHRDEGRRIAVAPPDELVRLLDRVVGQPTAD